MKNLSVLDMAKIFDQTLLRPDATNEEMEKFCKEADEYHFKMVAIHSAPVSLCKHFLKNSDVLVGAAIGFPLGQTTIQAKVFETKDAIEHGADEIDYVINIRELKSGNFEYIQNEMESIVDVCNQYGKTSKVILENCYLTDEEKIKVCQIAVQVKPNFVKTSTGFGTGGATLHDIHLMKSIVGDQVKIKAAGGIRTLADVQALLEAGVSRIGTSRGVSIIEEYKQFLSQNTL